MFMMPMVGYEYCLESHISWLNLFHIKQSTQEGKKSTVFKLNVRMDLETELLEEQSKDPHSNKDTLNEHIENEVGNISSEVHDFTAVNTSMKG